MRFTRLALAHLVTLAALTGCADSHGRMPLSDGGGAAADGGPAPRDSGTSARDAAAPIDAGPRGSCEPEDARERSCPDSLCDAPPTWHWNGDSCVPIECGKCEGADCAGAPRSRAECEAAHAACEPVLCERTGGEWLWWAEECGHYECGVPPPVECLIGQPVCRCGFHQRFDPELGCVDMVCPSIEAVAPEDLCRGTGGEWGAFCCNSVCGERCALACAAMACHCPGPTEVFDSVRGCVPGHECYERELGQTCYPGTRCAPGTICCGCEGPTCGGAPTCVAPVCDGDPTTDACGHDALAP